MAGVKQVIGDTFPGEVLKSDLPVVVDFYADWCGPCRMLSPMLERLASEFDGEIKFVKINTDDEVELTEAFKVSGLPTLLFMDDGKPIGQSAGLPDEDVLRMELTRWIETRNVPTR